MGRLENKVAVITGGAGAMGNVHARTFIAEGAKVVVADLPSAEGRELAEELGENAIFVELDVTSESSWKQLITKTEEKFGPINILVNNAGIGGSFASIEEVTLEQYRKVIEINQDGVFMGMKHVLPSMKKTESSSIINISSTAGFRGGVNISPYIASKFAVRGLTKAAAVEFAPYNIRVNSVHPGTIETPMLLEGMKARVPELLEAIPFKRFAKPQEVTNLVVYLASDESSYSTGAEFIVDGGLIQYT